MIAAPEKTLAVRNGLGSIVEWKEPYNCGTVRLDGGGEWFVHSSDFPAEQRPYLRKTRRISFSADEQDAPEWPRKPRIRLRSARIIEALHIGATE